MFVCLFVLISLIKSFLNFISLYSIKDYRIIYKKIYRHKIKKITQALEFLGN